MMWGLIVVLGLLASFIIFREASDSSRMFQLPIWMSLTFILFLFPQVIGLRTDLSLPEWSLERVGLMSILCLGLADYGYRRATSVMPHPYNYNLDVLAKTSIGLTVFGVVCYLLLDQLPIEELEISQWTGRPVALIFLAASLDCGIAIAATLPANNRSTRTAKAVMYIAILLLVVRSVLWGRRSMLAKAGFLYFGGRWIASGQTPPRWLLGVLVIMGVMIGYSIGEYRDNIGFGGDSIMTALGRIDFMSNISSIFAIGGPEIRNCAFSMDAVTRTRGFDYGLFHWNMLVTNFIPAQLTGAEFKQSLMINVGTPLQMARDVLGHNPITGSTATGLADCFGSLWYLGAIKFFIIGWSMKWLVEASRQGHLLARATYPVLLMPALVCVTHNTQWILSSFIQYGIFLWPAFRMARLSRSQ